MAAAYKAFAAVAVVIAMIMLSAINVVSAQEVAAPAPAPSIDKGAAYSLSNNGAVICSSLLLSLLVALFRH